MQHQRSFLDHHASASGLAVAALAAALATACVATEEPDVVPEPGGGSHGKADDANASGSQASVRPLLQTLWGQGGAYQARTPLKHDEPTYPGCTTIASAQILFYYQYQNHASSDVSYVLEHGPLSGPGVTDDGYSIDLDLPSVSYDWDAMALSLDNASAGEIDATATFIYHVAATLNNQFGGGAGSSATGKQVENAFRYQWGYNNIARRQMSVITRDAFGYDDDEWEAVVKGELDAGRPVLHMAQQQGANVGHAFVIDGYNRAGEFHVNWGWGGHGNGYYDLNVLEDPSGRQWTRDAMIFRGLEPEEGYAAALLAGASEPDDEPAPATDYSWNGNFSLISYSSDTTEGYGLTEDEARIHPNSPRQPVVFLQWEVDARDGKRLELSADGASSATVTYGLWSQRSGDRVYEQVSLPFVLDPARDGFDVTDGEYFTIAIAFEDTPSESVSVLAAPTSKPATDASSMPAGAVSVDGLTWNGNGSLISYSSGTQTGYGLTQDEAQIHPGSSSAPVVFLQWEIDARDGRKLELAAEGISTVTITYGSWDDRSKDVTRTVALPYQLDPAADGLSTADGTYYVIKLAFSEPPAQPTPVTADIVP